MSKFLKYTISGIYSAIVTKGLWVNLPKHFINSNSGSMFTSTNNEFGVHNGHQYLVLATTSHDAEAFGKCPKQWKCGYVLLDKAVEDMDNELLCRVQYELGIELSYSDKNVLGFSTHYEHIKYPVDIVIANRCKAIIDIIRKAK